MDYWKVEYSREEFRAIAEEMLESGFRPGSPGDAADYDRPIAESSGCADCEWRFEYKPYLKPAHLGRRSEYRAFAVCGRCAGAIEF